jgi:hypothetical protein
MLNDYTQDFVKMGDEPSWKIFYAPFIKKEQAMKIH